MGSSEPFPFRPDFVLDMDTVLITGASRGIGAAAVRRLSKPGRQLVLMARGQAALEARAREVEARGGTAIVLPVDLAEPDEVRARMDGLAEAGHRIDGLVLNAGVARGLDFARATRASAQREMEVNYFAPVEIMRRVLPGMLSRGQGRIVVVGSLTSFVPFPGNAGYCASKAALYSFVRSVRIELRGSGVHLGMVMPGYTKTDMTTNLSTRVPAMSADEVADAISLCYERRRSLVVPGTMNRFAARMFGAFPTTSDRMLTRVARFVIPSST